MCFRSLFIRSVFTSVVLSLLNSSVLDFFIYVVMYFVIRYLFSSFVRSLGLSLGMVSYVIH